MQKRLTRTSRTSETWAGWVFAFLAVVTVALAQTTPAAPTPGDPFDRLQDEYLNGRWDEVEGKLAASSKEVQAIPPSEQPKVNYMRQALAECRPAWWKQCKVGEKFDFAPNVWGRVVKATFDPAAKTAVQFSFFKGHLSLTVTWARADMDSTAAAQYGFSKGDFADFSAWSTLGMAEAWGGIPMEAQNNLNDEGKVLLQRYVDFRSNLTGVYYGTPRARRLGLWGCLVMYVGENAGNPVRTARESIAAMFMGEVVTNPAKYPSIQLPKTIPMEGAEEKLAWELMQWLGKHGWTLAEDKYLRDAIAAFAMVNGRQVHFRGQVLLPNGLVVAVDPDKDKLLRPKRDQWLKAKFDAAVQKP